MDKNNTVEYVFCNKLKTCIGRYLRCAVCIRGSPSDLWGKRHYLAFFFLVYRFEHSRIYNKNTVMTRVMESRFFFLGL